MKYSILYRGALSSCNYNCDYCPFKKNNNKNIFKQDEIDLKKFVDWIKNKNKNKDKISVFFK